MAGTRVICVVAERHHATELAEKMRPAERAELIASMGQDPLAVVQKGIVDSAEAWSVFFDGELACIWGVVEMPKGPDGEKLGLGWLLSTSVVERKAKTFWSECLRILPELLSRWDVIVNAIDLRHTQALRWADRLGFRFETPRPMGPDGIAFTPFSITQEDLCVHQQSSPT